jgi:hypothetical protein
MKFSFNALLILAASAAVDAAPRRKTKGRPDTAALDTLLPQFGVVAGTNKDANGNCQGINLAGKITPIQCQCPPDRTAFLKKLGDALAAGKVSVPDDGGGIHEFPITFNTTAPANDEAANRQRATAALTVLQNFDGKFGKGCPAVSVPNFQSMQSNGVRVDRQLVPPI